jgi:predicted DCC family thiol-disulfide oxidoreductase YuxK
MDYFPASDPKSEQLLLLHGIPREITDKTVIFVDNNQVYIKSTAVIKALQKRSGIWKAALLLKIIPLFVRDKIYDWIAGRRV